MQAAPGILVGYDSPNGSGFYVVAIAKFPVTARALNRYLSKYENVQEKDEKRKLRALGVWSPQSGCTHAETRNDLLPRLFREDRWISIKVVRNASAGHEVGLQVEIYAKTEAGDVFTSQEYEKLPQDQTVIVYNQKEIWDMELFPDSILKRDSANSPLSGLFNTISHCKNGILSYEAGLSCKEECIAIVHCCTEYEASIAAHVMRIFVTLFFGVIYGVLKSFQRTCGRTFSAFSPVFKLLCWVMKLSSFFGHMLQRFSNVAESVLMLYSAEKSEERTQRRQKDIIASFCVDAAFGIMMLVALHYFKLVPDRTVKEVFLPYAEAIAGQVEGLIKWLMGIPAGLKLNHRLNQFLGHFFLYHVRLWLEYARMMMNLFPNLMTYCLLSSCMGLSFFLAIICDTVSTLSFHIYCFYVYAGRLYGLQVTGLMSLWRLFRGKKWNPLRKRVDSLEDPGQRADQLFLGTLLFTVLLFLLPTTALYYGIFTLLRVAVLFVQVVLGGLVFLFSEFPWYSAALRIFSPQKFTSTVRFDCGTLDITDTAASEESRTSVHPDGRAILLHMSLQPKSYLKCVAWGLQQGHHSSIMPVAPRALFKMVLLGDLVRWS